MDYRMLTLIPEMDVARELMKYIQVNGIDAYIEDKTNYEKEPIDSQWAVMVDSKGLGKAKKLLTQFNELKVQESIVDEEIVVEKVEQQADADNYEAEEPLVGEDEEQEVYVMEDDEEIPPLPYEEPFNTSNLPDFNYDTSSESSSAGCAKSFIFLILFIIFCINFYSKCQRSYQQRFDPPRIEHFDNDFLNRYRHNHNYNNDYN